MKRRTNKQGSGAFETIHWLTFILCLMVLACQPSAKEYSYLYLSHIYDWASAATNDQIDPRVAALPLAAFDQIWLGGDLCGRTSEKIETLYALDSIFGFSQNRAHWSLGNHDLIEGNMARIEKVTGKPSFYVQWQNGLVLLILNTNFNHPQHGRAGECASMETQYQLIENVCDTIREASHLVILHHHVLCTNALAEGEADMREIYHYYVPELSLRCVPEETFTSGVYPQLVEVQKQGVQVILIGGDIGMRAKKFSLQTGEGIWFLGAGINGSLDPSFAPAYVTNFNPDSVLIFSHRPEVGTLSWDFKALSDIQ